MPRRWIAQVIFGGALLAGCGTDSGNPTGDTGAPEVPRAAPAYLVNAAVTGPVRSVFVSYRPGAPADRLQQAMIRDVRSGGEIVGGRLLALEVSSGSKATVIEALRRMSWIESVAEGNDDNVPQADVLPWGISNAGANLVNSLYNNRGTGIKVSFLDTGVDCTHPDLSGRVVGGYDFVNGNSTYCIYSSAHGTGVAGIIAASINGSGVIGMAPEANLYSLRVCTATSCLDSRIALALQWAADNGMKVASLSVANCGADSPAAVALAAANAYAAGVVVVAAAGNGTANGCPANSPVSGIARLPNVLAVSAMNSNFTTPSGYQYGPEVDLAAPTNVQTDNVGGGTVPSFGGTSASTPHVAGAVALLFKQGYTTSAIFGRLTTEAVDRGVAGKDNYFGYGSLDALTAVQAKPYVSDIVPCYNPPLYEGDCALTPVITNGISPFLVKWEVTYSNGSHAPINTGFIAPGSYSIPVPYGSYSITVTATPKENGVRTRTGSPAIRSYPVCPGGALPVSPNGDGPTPNAIC